MVRHTSIREAFVQTVGSLEVDHALYHHICDMEARFVNKKQEHIEFFGGTLTGVHVVRFTDTDRDRIFSEILNTDEGDLETAVYSIPFIKGKQGVNRSWMISSDIFNISCVYLLHAIEHGTSLDENQKHEAKIRVCSYLFYKFLTSLLYQYFKYPADPEVAQATYANLTNKFALKQFGNWHSTIRDLAEKAVDPKGIHEECIKNLEDERVIYFLNDTQGRIRDMLKNIYSVFDRLNREGVRITSSSSLQESEDGEMILKENTKSPGVYARYLKTIISDRNSFIKQELVDVIVSIMHTMSPRLLMQTLEWTSENYQKVKNGEIDQAVDIVMEHAIDYLSGDRSSNRNHLLTLVDKLRGAYMSSRSTDEKLLKARDLIERIVKNATHSRNDSGIAAVRTAWMLYIVLRAYSKNHYSSR